jgi:hypothetical protein
MRGTADEAKRLKGKEVQRHRNAKIHGCFVK